MADAVQSAPRRIGRPTRRAILIALAVLAAGMAIGAGVWWRAAELPRRFATVEPGRLYRSGKVAPGQLARLQREPGISRVISLLDSGAPITRAEQAAAQRLGLEWHNVPLAGDGSSMRRDRDRLRALLMQPSAPPTLVHCAAGVNRTGLAVGMYRLHCQGWSLEQVMAELRSTAFEDLPKHQNLRDALAEEAQIAQAMRASASTAPAALPRDSLVP